MPRTAISSDAAPPALGPYSQAIVANGFVFCSGTAGIDPVTGEVPEGIEAQTEQALRNLAAVLAEAGLTLADVVKSTVHLQHVQRDFAAYDQVYRQHFSAPYPVRTTVGSDLLGILVEIDVVAARS